MKLWIVGALMAFAVYGWAQEIDTTRNGIVCNIRCEHPPEFPGGFEALSKFLKENVKYPFRRTCIQGTVFIRFIVCDDGSLTDFVVIKGLCKECDESALDALKKMPRWIPAVSIDRKNPVRQHVTLPVKFSQP